MPNSVLNNLIPPSASQQLSNVPKPQQDFRSFDDSTSVRNKIFENVLKAAQDIKPVANVRHRLELSDVHYPDSKEFSLKQQKQAVLQGNTLSRRLRGTWRLYDNLTNDLLDEQHATLAQVPYMTERGMFIINGNEVGLGNQMRLRSGVFTRIKDNGEAESHANVGVGTGPSHRYFLDPVTGVFKINIGQSKVPLISVLKTLGASDKELKEHWGNALYNANMQKDDPLVIDKIYSKLIRHGKAGSTEEKSKELVAAFHKMELDSEVTKRTLGKPFDRLSKDAIIQTTKRLLAVAKGEEDPDDRDHLAFQTFLGPEDLLSERVGKDRTVMRQTLWRAFIKNNLSHIQPNMFTKQIMHSIMGSGLGQNAEEVNSMDVLDQKGRATRLGEGGITSMDSVPDECYDEQTEVFTYDGWKFWKDVTMEDRFACLIEGRLEFHRPLRLFKKKYNGTMYGLKTKPINYLVTPGHQLWCRIPLTQKEREEGKKENEWKIELASEVHGKPREFQITSLPYQGSIPSIGVLIDGKFIPPFVKRAIKTYIFDAGDWAELVGWYVSEGCISSYALRESSTYRIRISQDIKANPDKVKRIKELLERMGIRVNYARNEFSFVSKQIGKYLEELGMGAVNKQLPLDFMEWPVEMRRRLFESLMLGDGSVSGGAYYATISKKLLTDFLRLVTSLGNVTREKEVRVRELAHHRDVFGCNLPKTRVTGTRNPRTRAKYYTTEYDGNIYCAEVPGNLLFVRRDRSWGVYLSNSRSVQPSHLNYVDVIRTPESGKVGIDSRIAFMTKKGADGKLYSPFLDLKGNTTYKTPQDVADLTVAFPNELATGKKYVAAMVKGRTRFVSRDKVQYEMPAMEHAFSPLTNLIPGKSGIKGQRVSMGARFITQALPLRYPEAPLVQSGMPDNPDRSFEEHYSKHAGAVFADTGGKVIKQDDDSITVENPNGEIRNYDLYHEYPYNRKTLINNTSMVKNGDIIKPGQLLAKSNQTDDNGTIALGKNPRVAYIPFRGRNYEDAIVISESFAKATQSEHMYQHEFEFTPNIKQGKKTYISLFPTKYDKNIIDKMDDDGVIKPGQIVNHHDPLVLAAQEREPSFGQIHKGRGRSYSDKSETWDHHYPGIVTDVAKTKKGAVIAVKAYATTEVGDKLCFDKDTELLTRTGWKNVADVNAEDEFATLNGDFLEYQKSTALHAYPYNGPMFSLQSQQLDILVTPEHKLWVARRNEAYQAVTAKDFAESTGTWLFKKDCIWKGKEKEWMIFDKPPEGSRKYLEKLKMDDWLEFLGYYIAEGHCHINKASGAKYMRISQADASPYTPKIAALLDRIGLTYYRESGNSGYFQITNKWLHSVLAPLGNSAGKYVPAYVQELSQRQIRIFFDAYMDGDGHRGAGWEFSSKSGQLIEDLGIICLKLGLAANVKKYDRKHKNRSDSTGWRIRINRKKLRPWWNKHRSTSYSNFMGWKPYDGIVYCVTVPNGVVYARRNRIPLWNHNSSRLGSKGIISEICPDHEMPHGEDGKPMEVLLNPLGVISRCYDDQTEFLTISGWILGKYIKDEDSLLCYDTKKDKLVRLDQSAPFYKKEYSGILYKYSDQFVDFAVTPGHSMWINNTNEWRKLFVDEIAFTDCTVKTGRLDRKLSKENWRVETYEGTVYCPTVPTSFVLTRRNNKTVVASNTNPFQMVETALGKIAAVIGKPYKIQDFKNIKDLTQFAMDELEKHGMKDTETLTDPLTGNKIPNVMTGQQFMMKLHHTAAAKGQGRGLGSYTAEQVPAKGGEEGSKKLSLMDTNALLSSGATEILKDASQIRGQKNDNYWQMFMSGFRPPDPEVPFVYRKFIAGLQAAGINPVRKGGQIHIMALTNKDIDKLVGDRFIRNAETVDWKAGLKPIKGGLFDPALTGGHGQENRWSAVKLHEPMPSPVFEDPIRRLLGLTQKQYEEVLSGKQGLGKTGKLYDMSKQDNLFGHGTGTGAIQKALESINLDSAIQEARAMTTGSKKTARDVGIRKLRILKDAKRLNLHPKDWIVDKVPVLPPAFRPVSVLQGSNAQMVADPNYLYKELFDANQSLEQLKPQLEDVTSERLQVYNAFKGVVGLGDPISPKNAERQVQGILKNIFGSSPKFGAVQSKLLGSTVDLVGRAVIAPNPDMDMDSCGLPENRAWPVYTPFIIRRLVRKGMPRLVAAKAVKDKSKLAREALLEEMAHRPVMINRAPVLHRYGIMASWPILVKGDTLQLSPIVTKGFGADFDGDAMQYHVPATDEARDEAITNMLPSRNLLAVSNFKAHYLPSQEYVGGLYAASTKNDNSKKPRVFDTKESAVAAYRRGEIRYDQPVEILRH